MRTAPVALALALAMLAALAAAACNKANPNYCDETTPCPGGAPCDLVDHSCPAVDAAGPACTSSQDCPGTLPYCDVGGSDTCVVCGPDGPSACTGTAPVCEDFACRPCSLDSECASGVCLPDGACPPPEAVVHAGPAGTGTECSAATPCTIQQALATTAAMPANPEPVIKLAAGTYDIAATLPIARDLTLIGPALASPTATPTAIIRHNGGTGPAIHVDGQAVTFYQLVVEEANDTVTGNGIRCEGGRVVLRFVELRESEQFQLYGLGCDLVVDRSAFLSADGGGIYVSAGSLDVARSRFDQVRGGGIHVLRSPFAITNNHFYLTGNEADATFGAIKIENLLAGTAYTLAFNTLVDSRAAEGFATGITCEDNLQAMGFTSNIVMDGDDTTFDVETESGTVCSHSFSYIEAGEIGDGGNNLPAATPPGIQADHFHLTADSIASGAADPAATIGVDIDGDPRPMPAATARDIGADEID
jgi:hypothetical protein